jgi:hypothetical protein
MVTPLTRTRTTVAYGCCDDNRVFTLKLDRPVTCNSAFEDLAVDMISCKIPPDLSYAMREQIWFEWRVRIGQRIAWASRKTNMRPVRRYNMEDMLTDLTSPDDAGGINPVYQWVWVEPGIDEDFFNGNWYVDVQGVFDNVRADGDDINEMVVALYISEHLQLLLGWPNRTMVIRHGQPLPPTNRPIYLRQSVNIMCEGVEESSFQGTMKKPYLDSCRLIHRHPSNTFYTLGGTVPPRAFRKPYRYVGHINGELRKLKMWVEDDYGEKHAFAAGGQMCAHLMWRITRKGCEEGSGAVVHANPDPLEGVVVLNLDGDEGIWNMGGIVDWSGWSRIGMRERTSAPASYEVALLSVCQSFERYPRAAITGIGVGMPDFLADYMGVPNNLHVAPWGETPDGPRRLSEDSLLEAAVPRYKRIAPVAVAHTRVVLSPVPTEPDKFDYENYKTGKAKIVLHVRRIAECIER